MGDWKTTDEGKRLSTNLENQQILAALNRLLERVESIEGTLGNLIDQGPTMTSILVDSIDDTARQAEKQGINIDERVRTTLQLVEKLTAPNVVEKLNFILEMTNQLPGLVSMKVDMLDDLYKTSAAKGVDLDERLRSALEIAEKLTAPAMVDRLNTMLQVADQLPGLISMKVDMLDDMYKNASSNGVDIDERLRAGIKMAERLTAPAMIEKLEGVVTMAENSSGMIAMAVDSFDSTYRLAAERGMDLETLAKQMIDVTKKMGELLNSEEMKAIIDGGMLDPKALTVMGAAGKALSDTQNEPPQKVGLFGMLRAMGSPDMKRALGFLTSFAKQFGKNL